MGKTWWFMLGLAIVFIGLYVWIVPQLPQYAPTNVPDPGANGLRVDTPTAGSLVEAPLVVRGEARGMWFFEASFPIELRDGNDSLLATGIAQAEGEWMTEEFVPFEATLEWTRQPSTGTGYLYFRPDDPSGGENPRFDGVEWKMAVRFE